MASFAYKARDSSGKSVQGNLDAAGREEALKHLRQLGLVPTQVREAKAASSAASKGSAASKDLFEDFERVSTEQMILFNIQLANLLNAGITLLASLNAVTHQIESKKLRQAIEKVTRSVEEGDSFSDALAKDIKVFPMLFVNMVRAGEASGKLGLIMTRYAAFTESEADLKNKITGALMYPLILLTAGFGVALFIVITILPKFVTIFVSVGLDLPGPTLVIYNAGQWTKQYWYVIPMVIGGIIFSVGAYGKTPKGRLNLDRLKLNLPLFGALYRKAGISRFARTFGMLFSSGVPILHALALSRDVLGNEVLAEVISKAQASVERGERISDAIRVSKEFPSDLIQMMLVGEETGALDDMMEKVADLYERSINYALKKITSLMEPILLGVLGALIGVIMAAMLLPMFDMIKVLRR